METSGSASIWSALDQIEGEAADFSPGRQPMASIPGGMSTFLTLPSPRRLSALLFVLACLSLAAPRLHRENFFGAGGVTEEMTPLPEFPVGVGEWIGTDPKTIADLGGDVWILKVWTFGCVNCVRSIPFTNELQARFDGKLRVLGIHSPEFDWERDPIALAEVLLEHEVQFPSYLDQDLAYFHALEAPGWPAYYVVDRKSRIRGRWIGEVHSGTMRDRAMSKLIQQLLDEPQ